MANILQILGAAGKGLEGYGIDRQRRVTNALAQSREGRDAENDRVRNLLLGKQTELLGAPKAPEPEEYAPAKFVRGGKPVQGFAGKRGGKYYDANMQPITDAVEPYEPPAEPKAAATPRLITIPDPNDPGKLIRGEDKAGQEVPGPSAGSGMGGAAIKKALASNTSQLAVIDDALKELETTPGAVGLLRGLPMIGDRLDPRADPAGVAARASIANIGSLKIHDRSGAAVSVHEFPRLAPFIPSISDPPEAIKVKLAKLREAINVETEALRQQGGGAGGGQGGKTLTPEQYARVRQHYSDAELRAQGYAVP